MTTDQGGKYQDPKFITVIKVPAHSLRFNEMYFLQLIAGSLSLTIEEKRKIIESIPKLSQKQIDELIKIFEEEIEKFNELAEKHDEQIQKLRDQCKTDWQALEVKQRTTKKQEEDQKKAEEIRAKLFSDQKAA
ncbi:hypothetical protein COT40_00240 [Candidatus Peregrinibacteria bacterium CG08_land_8_20_14_0_20_41_10]|nr:MAG: hypothetical protein AUJ78_00195 [Candidatus Peregrinibacteria bacterium CG1_02_41_10]PIS32398.1 MAG: hypothetical protein COT40_00240 [Candidatus Peregrinibacteria bacterium CG08_land_8_20_14_0_20_41_10]